MSYTLCAYNGNCGSETTYDTLAEARSEGDIIWGGLSASDKRRYTDRDAGACFCISENDADDIAISTAYDYADELEE